MSRPRGPSPHPTVKKVARLAGVAMSTASRVLHGHDPSFPIAARTRERVLHAAQRIGYPLSTAEPIPAIEAGLVALVNGVNFAAAHTVLADLPDHLLRALRPRGYQLALISLDEAATWRQQGWHQRTIGAILLEGVGPFADELLGTLGVPTVAFNWPGELPCDQVLPDDAMGMALAATHLLDLGHRRIAFLRPPIVQHTRSANERYRSLVEHLAARGGRVIEGLVEHQDYGHANFSRLLRELWSLPPDERPTALICLGNGFMSGLYDALAEAGLRIPADLSVISGNDAASLELLRPRPTAVEVPIIAMAAAAVELLLARRDGTRPAEPVRRILVERLVVRDSTAPPH